MPRVRASNQANAYTSPVKKVQIPLNDDDEEKAKRLQSRKIAATKQMEQYKAAASPVRKRKSLGDGPQTPSQEDQYGVAGNAVTPMKRVPILANFEEWMKMATDNKINATNSWNFALIDYFHDMSLLREGDSVNFQKASCTLDGCVKIYTSRVDSVATETGKLLSGLAASKEKKRRGEDEAGEEGEEDEEGEEGGKKKTKKRAQRSAEATLVKDFEQLRLKKMELEFSVDPLFKKAAADFDEGGAKGLLMNHLSIDSTGRIVFDSSDDAQEPDGEENRRDSMEPESQGEDGDKEKEPAATSTEDGLIDIAALGARFFPDLSKLDSQEICAQMSTFELGSGDASLDLPFLKAPDNWRDEHPEGLHSGDDDQQTGEMDDGPFGGMDDDDAPGGFDLPPETGFGEGGEAWARDAALQPQMRVHDVYNAEGGEEGGEVGTFDANANSYGVTLQHRNDRDQENILNYFDTALHKNWAGPEHWKIAKIKEANKAANAPKREKKEKEPFEIDFFSPMTQDLANALYTSASSNSVISLPKKDWRSKTRNLLPDDKHFNSNDLLKLFLKPKAKLGARKGGRSQAQVPADGEVDEAYWATHGGNAEPQPQTAEEVNALQGDYDANFFADDALPMADGIDLDADEDEAFADAREHFSPEADAGPVGPGIDAVAGSQEQEGEGAFGANLIAQSRRLRPEYVQYARVAKKVDVRRLKEEMWRGIGFEKEAGKSGIHFYDRLLRILSLTPTTALPPQTPSKPPAPALAPDESGTLGFVQIMNNLRHSSRQKQLEDISTSYGFISLLHLANEKGLVIENCDGWTDLRVRRDEGAVISEGHI